MTKNGQPRVGVVGCGYWGRNLIRNYHEMGRLGAVCDVNKQNLQEMVQKYPAQAVTSFDQLLGMNEIDAIVIATPAATHHALVKSAILAGKDVFVEKPLALRVEEGEELGRLARDNKRILMVGHLLHYHPAIKELRRMLHAGEFGRVDYVSSSRLNLGKLRTEEDILWSFAPHDISAILYLLNEVPSVVSAQGANYLSHSRADVTLSVLNFTSGVKAHVFVSWMHPYKEQKLTIVGDRQMAVFDDTESDKKLVLYPHRVDWIDRVPVARKAEGVVVPLEKTEPLRAECQHFLECVEQRKTPDTDGENGIRVLRILHACGESMRLQGQPLAVESTAPKYFAHSSAFVDSPCEVGKGTKIWHFSHVMPNSKIGKNCNLGQNVHVASDVIIGNNVKIQNNVSLYTGVELEDDVFCGPSMVFTNVITPRSHVNRKAEYQRTLVKRGATLGANCTVVCGVTIGEYAFVGAGAVVTRDVPDHALMMGVPARQAGWVCHCGVRLQVSDGVGVCPSCSSSLIVDQDAVLQRGRLAASSAKHQTLAAAAGAD